MNTALKFEETECVAATENTCQVIPFPGGKAKIDSIIQFPKKTANNIRFKDRNYFGTPDLTDKKWMIAQPYETLVRPHEDVEGEDRSNRTRLDDTPSERRVVYDRPHEAVEPIKDPADIERAKQYFLNKGFTKENVRNYMMFVVNINNAVRISDLLTLRIEDVLEGMTEDNDWIIRTEVFIRERKTGKTRYLFFGPASQTAIKMYLDTLDGNFKMTDYLFSSSVTNKDGSNKAISRQQAWNIVHKLGEELGLHLGTHSMRKTFGYQKISQSNNDPMIVAQVSEIYNHQSMNTTYRYLGMDTESKRELCTKCEL